MPEIRAKTPLQQEFWKEFSRFSLAFESHLNDIVGSTTPQEVEKLVGNTPEIIMKHYAGSTRNIQIPEF